MHADGVETESLRHRLTPLAASDDRHLGAVFPQHLCHQQTQTARTHDRGQGVRFDRNLLDDPARCGGGLDEDGSDIVERRRDGVKVRRRQRQIFSKCSVAPADADDGTDIAVSPTGRATSGALSAAHGNFSDDRPADPLRVIRARLFNDADEFVTGYAREPGVAAKQLQIGAADAGACDTNQTLAAGARLRSIAKRQGPVGVEHKGAHRARLPRDGFDQTVEPLSDYREAAGGFRIPS